MEKESLYELGFILLEDNADISCFKQEISDNLVGNVALLEYNYYYIHNPAEEIDHFYLFKHPYTDEIFCKEVKMESDPSLCNASNMIVYTGNEGGEEWVIYIKCDFEFVEEKFPKLTSTVLPSRAKSARK